MAFASPFKAIMTVNFKYKLEHLSFCQLIPVQPPLTYIACAWIQVRL